MHVKHLLCRYAAISCFAVAHSAVAGDGIDAASKGQTVYVPIYSEIWHGNNGSSGKANRDLMSALVSIRNTDQKVPIRVLSAPYYNTAGTLISDYVPTPRIVAPLATLELFVEHRENAGGSGANFSIRWDATSPASPPIIEAVHTSVQLGRTMVFISRGKPISSP